MNADDQHKFYDEVYGKDNPPGDAHGWIQWKGTDVCMDTHCQCGYHGHVDCDFFYFYECPKCHAKYAVGSNVKLIPLTPDQIAHAEARLTGFKTCILEEE